MIGKINRARNLMMIGIINSEINSRYDQNIEENTLLEKVG